MIWLIPIVAALVTGYLGWRTFSDRGPLITVSFGNADGLTAGQTPVVLDMRAGFDPEVYARAVRDFEGPRRYTSLVPTHYIMMLGLTGAARYSLLAATAFLALGFVSAMRVRRAANESSSMEQSN